MQNLDKANVELADTTATNDLTVLVVDDSKLQRKIVTAFIQKWGFRIFEAASADEGLEICRNETIDIVVSDWMMPGMNGLDFCRAYKSISQDHFGYFILVTSKSEKSDVAEGLNTGADDFLTKPVSSDELLARMIAGQRIVEMERAMKRRNEVIQASLDKINSLYRSLERDLAAARKLQHALVPEKSGQYGPAKFDAMLRPSGHVGGDLVGFSKLTCDVVAFFSLDVSGHGVASAMITAQLADYLIGSKSKSRAITMSTDKDGNEVPATPSHVTSALNKYVLEGIDTDHYFTISYGHFNTRTREVNLCQCGHPDAIVQKANGEIELVGDGGLPVGLFNDACWEDITFTLDPGSRLFFFSDGVSEMPNGRGEMLGDEGLIEFLKKNSKVEAHQLFDRLIWDLAEYAGNEDFPDDISALLIEVDP